MSETCDVCGRVQCAESGCRGGCYICHGVHDLMHWRLGYERVTRERDEALIAACDARRERDAALARAEKAEAERDEARASLVEARTPADDEQP